MQRQLRFKNNGIDFEDPDYLCIEDLFDKVKETNKNNKYDNVITNSAEFGLIPQRQFFDKDIAVKENTGKYTVIRKGDFVYNPRKSTTAPYGPFNCYEFEEPGIVSPLYSCLRPKDGKYTQYLLHYFASSAWHSYIYHNGNQGGARHDRVGMTDDLLMGIPVYFPEEKEQEKIVEFLDLIDQRIDNQTKLLRSVEKRRNGILTKLFDGTLEIFDGSYDSWEDTMLSDVLKERKEKSHGNEEVYSVSVAKGLVNQIEHLGRSFAAEDTSKYKVACPGDVIYTKSPTGEFKWGIVKQSTIDKKVIISPLYGVFIPSNIYIGYILDAYFSSSIRAHNYLITQIRKGAKNTINVSNAEFLNKSIYLPTCEKEQKAIADFIELLNQEVSSEREKLERMKMLKKSIAQKLFVL